jgi:3-hydroxy-9,10-secoandrosta-1,3,5(10)-triene-9,17-dione monooxygenase reductase component
MSSYTESIPPFDGQNLRKAFSNFATGVTIVTTVGEKNEDIGLTVNSFSSVSLDPALVLWSLKITSSSLPAFDSSGHFAVHILSAAQSDLSNRFASKTAHKFEGVDYRRGVMGMPVINNCTSVFECKTVQRIVAGDHVIFLGEVLAFARQDIDQQTLIFCQGQYVKTINNELVAQN